MCCNAKAFLFVRQRPICSPKGMTLIELVLALAVLVLVAGMVSGIARAALEAGEALVQFGREQAGVDASSDLLRHLFRTLPHDAKMQLVIAKLPDHPPSIVITGAPRALAWGSSDWQEGDLELSPKLTSDGLWQVGFGRSVPDPNSSEQTIMKLPWLPIFEGLVSVGWRFLDARSGQWQTQWDQGQHPAAIELTAQLPGEENPRRWVFWIPVQGGA